MELKPFLVILKSFMEGLVHDDVIGGLACPVIIIILSLRKAPKSLKKIPRNSSDEEGKGKCNTFY